MFRKTILCLGCIAFLFLATNASLGDDELFRPAQSYFSGGYYSQAIAIGDVNGDHKPDVIVSNRCLSYPDDCHGLIGVLLGNGDGTFQPVATYPSGGYLPKSISISDVNSDGKPDLLVGNSCLTSQNCDGGGALGVVAVLLGNGDGTFQTAVSYNSGGYRDFSLSVADVNQDSKPDLLVANMCEKADSCDQGAIGVLLGNGDGTFQPAKSYSSGGDHAFSIAVGDVNLDGKPDLTVVNGYSGNVAVLLGNGDGTFQTPHTYIPGGSNPSSIVVGDVNGDGKPDLVVTDICLNGNCMLGAVAVLLGNGDGTFLTAGTYSSGSYHPSSTALADIDGDGRLDALVIGEQFGYGLKTAGMVGVLRGNGDGTFQPVQSYLSGGKQVLSIAIGDLNEDHRLDVVVANWCLPKTRCSAQNGQLMGAVGVLTGMFGTTTSLSSSANPSAYGQKVTFAATVASSGPIPTGKVRFMDGSKGLGIVALKDGEARLSKGALAVGNHLITAHYLGNNGSAGSTSDPLDQVVQ